ncbi:hypothetical protein AK812_SmicGene16081 [Symbiodinium microadriaticum]|uniref:Uncharacterized protein n=1 Tax=Symbiodinium microadriaticum TaxID=2951 RepID=A0A1Q9E1B2_SYMMI|nr:hypothetical protein AK812_SmicGene16081 [Symbiodinium microadriaticum]
MVLRFLVLIGAAAVLKVSCGSDDLVWLAPFIAREKTRLRKAWVAFLYTVSVAFLVSIAAAAGLITNSMKGEKADLMKWWLKFLAGSLLIVYSVYMAYVDGWLKPCGLKGPDDEEEDDKEEGLLQTDASADSQGTRSNIVVVALLGRVKRLRSPTDAMDQFRAALANPAPSVHAVRTAHKKHYPMWVVPVEEVLKMTGPPPGHQQLLAEGILKKWRPGWTSIMVSHQWLGAQHPDLRGEHLSILQGALRNIISGKVRVCSDIAFQFMGKNRILSKAERAALAKSYIWLDWWSIPQISLRSFYFIDDATLERDQDAGIRSIPFYVSVSRFFISLVPPLRHQVTGKICDYGTYLQRGWCRAELWCRYLACSNLDLASEEDEVQDTAIDTGRILPAIVVSATDCIEHTDTQTHRHTDTQTHRHTDTQTHRHTDTQTHRHTDTQTHRHTDTQTHRHTDTQTHRHTDTQTHRHTDTQTHRHTDTQFGSTETWRHCLAHEGEFTLESDRESVGEMCRAALDLKLRELSESPKDLDLFRVLASRREDLTGAEERVRSVEEFLAHFKFASLETAAKVRRGIGGLACATLSGDLPMMRRLFDARASLTTRAKEMFEVGIGPDFTPLFLAVVRSRHSTEPLELLLQLRSDPNEDAGPSSCALGWCPSARAVEVMVQARADVNRVSGPPFRITPLQTAAMTHQRREVFAILLEKKADLHKLGHGLRPPIMNELAVFCHLGYPERLDVAQLLVEKGADVNQKTEAKGMMYMLSLFARLRIRFPNPSVVVRVFADLDIPSLGCAAIVGEAEMVRFLLRARADPMVKSSRGVPVKDMARSDEIRKAMDTHLERSIRCFAFRGSMLSWVYEDQRLPEKVETLWRGSFVQLWTLLILRTSHSFADGCADSLHPGFKHEAAKTGLDDFTVYLIMAGSGIYTWYELILGTMLGCLILASIVLFLTESASLSHVLESIPAWAILLALGVVAPGPQGGGKSIRCVHLAWVLVCSYRVMLRTLRNGASLQTALRRLFVHPLPSKDYRSFASLSAPCCGQGFFAVVESEGRAQAQVCSPASVEGLGTEGAFDLRRDIPCARHSLKQKPHCLAFSFYQVGEGEFVGWHAVGWRCFCESPLLWVDWWLFLWAWLTW